MFKYRYLKGSWKFKFKVEVSKERYLVVWYWDCNKFIEKYINLRDCIKREKDGLFENFV